MDGGRARFGKVIPRWGIVAAVSLAAVVGTILVTRGVGGDPAPGPLRSVRPAAAPFRGLGAGEIRVGERTWSVVVADDLAEREQGLRGRASAAPYDGMLFVFGSDSEVSFTMAGVPAPLDVVFYDVAGHPVAHRRMVPCAGTDATCPLYSAGVPFRYALETASGAGPGPGARMRVTPGS